MDDGSCVSASLERLAALRRYALLDTPAEEAFDRLGRLAARLIQAPVALVTLVDADRQFFKACIGLPEPWATARGTPLSHSFCQHVAATQEPLIISDARRDPRVCDNLAIPDLNVIAYLGMPITTSDGFTLGSFCVIDHRPRVWTDADIAILQDLTASVVTEIELRHEIRERKQMEQALRRSEEYLRALIEHASDTVIVIATDGTIRYSSPALLRILGHQPGDQATTSIFDLVHPDDLGQVQDIFERLLTAPGVTQTAEIRLSRVDGSWAIFDMTMTNLLEMEAVRGFVINAHDITGRKQIEIQLAHGAFHDALTGLANRRLFFERLQQRLALAPSAPDQFFAVFFLDLDRFKSINDTLGHSIGDQLLVEVAGRLCGAVRASDLIARLSGDEFAVLVDNVQDMHNLTLVAERIFQQFARPFHLAGRDIAISTSIGCTLSSFNYQEADHMVREADIAMYYAKRQGKARHAIFDPHMHLQSVGQLPSEPDLRR